MPTKPVCIPCRIGHHNHCEMTSDCSCDDSNDGIADIHEILACLPCFEAIEDIAVSDEDEE